MDLLIPFVHDFPFIQKLFRVFVAYHGDGEYITVGTQMCVVQAGETINPWNERREIPQQISATYATRDSSPRSRTPITNPDHR